MKIPEAIRLSLTGVKKYVDNINDNLQENINNIDDLKADKAELFSGDYNDLENKPFYDTRIMESFSYDFDGIVDGKEYINMTDGCYFIKVSDDVNADDIDPLNENGTITFVLGETVAVKVVLSELAENLYCAFMISEEGESTPIAIVALENIESFITKGIWLTAITDDITMEAYMYSSNLTYKRIISGEIKKIDSVFINGLVGKNVETKSNTNESGDIISSKNAEIFNDYLTNMAIGEYSHAEGSNTKAIGNYSHTEGRLTVAEGSYSHAEGFGSTVKGTSSHAEGEGTTAKGYSSHAEGYNSVAEGSASHSEGEETWAPGPFSHAEGQWTVAEGQGSHAEGRCTWAKGDSQHVEGRFNIKDTENKYIHIAGNGTGPYTGDVNSYKTSNAYTLDWDGNGWFAGNVSIGADNKQLATEEFVTDKIAEAHKNDSQYVTQEQLNTVLGNITLKKVTQAEYDALTIKDPNTLYIIIQ